MAGACCQFLVAKTTSALWVSVLKRWDAVLGKVKNNSICLLTLMELHNASFSGSPDLFPHSALDKVVEKSGHVLHNEVICKVVSFE